MKKPDASALLTVDGKGKSYKATVLRTMLRLAFVAGAEGALQHADDYRNAEGCLVRANDFWRHMELSGDGYARREVS